MARSPLHQIESPSDSTKGRRDHRAKIQARVYIHDNERLYIATTEDLSISGTFISGPLPFTPGQPVHVVIKLPKVDTAIQLQAVVVRVESRGQSGIGIQFTKIDENAHKLIQKCVWQTLVEEALKSHAVEASELGTQNAAESSLAATANR